MLREGGFLVRFGVLLGCLALAAVNTGNNLLYLIFSIMIAVAAVSFVLTGRSLRRVEAVLEVPEEVPEVLGVEPGPSTRPRTGVGGDLERRLGEHSFDRRLPCGAQRGRVDADAGDMDQGLGDVTHVVGLAVLAGRGCARRRRT